MIRGVDMVNYGLFVMCLWLVDGILGMYVWLVGVNFFDQ